MTAALTIEVLFPEIANLHGDPANIDYLAQCRPDARVIRTGLSDRPAFVDQDVDLVYLGPMTEQGQLIAIERLATAPRPHRRSDRQPGGPSSSRTTRSRCWAPASETTRWATTWPGWASSSSSPRLRMFDRYNGKVMGVLPELGSEHPIVGYKSQFSQVTGDEALPGFLTAERGIGRNPATAVEGVRRGNFIGTSLIGPLLVLNPHFTRGLLADIDPDTEPTLAHESLAIAAYDARLRDFRDDHRWHRFERLARS